MVAHGELEGEAWGAPVVVADEPGPAAEADELGPSAALVDVANG